LVHPLEAGVRGTIRGFIETLIEPRATRRVIGYRLSYTAPSGWVPKWWLVIQADRAISG
jgi:hypothetical protein